MANKSKSTSGKNSKGKTVPRLDPRPQKTSTTKFTFFTNPTLTLVCAPSGVPVHFSLSETADLTGVHPELLRYYNRVGLIEAFPAASGDELFFDESALLEIRRIEHYRRYLGIGRRALPLICELRREGERQQIDLRFLRYPSSVTDPVINSMSLAESLPA